MPLAARSEMKSKGKSELWNKVRLAIIMLALPGPLFDASLPIQVAGFEIVLEQVDAPDTAASVWDGSVICCRYLATRAISGL